MYCVEINLTLIILCIVPYQNRERPGIVQPFCRITPRRALVMTLFVLRRVRNCRRYYYYYYYYFCHSRLNAFLAVDYFSLGLWHVKSNPADPSMLLPQTKSCYNINMELHMELNMELKLGTQSAMCDMQTPFLPVPPLIFRAMLIMCKHHGLRDMVTVRACCPVSESIYRALSCIFNRRPDTKLWLLVIRPTVVNQFQIAD